MPISIICFDRKGQWELFDLAKDPNELRNVYADPAYATVVTQLKAELARLQKELGDDLADVGARPRTGFERKR